MDTDHEPTIHTLSGARAGKEPLVQAAQLTWLFKAQGVPIHYRYARALIAHCPHAVRGRYITFSDAWRWWVLHPGFRPFSEKGEPAQRSLAELGENPTQSDTIRTGSH